MACCRSAPVTMTLASNESNEPEITEPASTPESTRTPGPAGGDKFCDGAGRGEEAAARVLAVDPELDRVPARFQISCPAELLAIGDAELRTDQIDSGGLLRHRMFHLQSRIDLQERHRTVLADQELHRPGTVIPGLQADRPRCRMDLGALIVGEERCRRLLDELLVPPLQRAVPGTDNDHRAVLVREYLGLDVPRTVQVPLDEAFTTTEGRHCLPDGRIEEFRDLFDRAGHLETPPAAAECGLDGDGQAVLAGER